MKKKFNKNYLEKYSRQIVLKDIGFESNENSVSIFYKNQDFEEIKKTSKSNLADKIVERIINHLN